MNLQQTLEKLAVVAGDWVDEIHERFGPYPGVSMMSGIPSRLPSEEWQLFGAICEKCEAEEWDWASHRFTDTPDGQAEYYFGINPMGSTEDGELGCGVSTEHPARAAANALLAALEAKACICNGTQQVRTIPNCDEGDFTEVMADCPFCTGKQASQ